MMKNASIKEMVRK